jgi:hypothetical protein
MAEYRAVDLRLARLGKNIRPGTGVRFCHQQKIRNTEQKRWMDGGKKQQPLFL